MVPMLIVAALLVAGGAYYALGAGTSERDRARVELEKDTAFREFLTRSHLKRSELKDQGEWNRWVSSQGHRPCATCNGAGVAGGASCSRCAGFGVEPTAK